MNQSEDLQTVLNIIKDETGVTVNQMRSSHRKQEIVWARYLFFHCVEFYLHWKDRDAYTYIGLDRTTHLHAHKKHVEFLQIKDKFYTDLYSRITKRLNDYFFGLPNKEILTNWQLKNARLFNQSILVGIDRTELFNGSDRMLRRNGKKAIKEVC